MKTRKLLDRSKAGIEASIKARSVKPDRSLVPTARSSLGCPQAYTRSLVLDVCALVDRDSSDKSHPVSWHIECLVKGRARGAIDHRTAVALLAGNTPHQSATKFAIVSVTFFMLDRSTDSSKP